MSEIIVITEGRTEREVGKVLYDGEILSHKGIPKPPDWSTFQGPREGFEQVIKALKESNPIASTYKSGLPTSALLIFDQEKAPTPADRVQEIERLLKSGDNSGFWVNISFSPVEGVDNLFEYRNGLLHLILHISSATVDDIPNKDFDGYILQILQGPFAERIVSNFIRGTISALELLKKAKDEFTNIMKRNGISWAHSKSWLYAYITVLQYRESHVWFSRDVVEKAISISKDYVKEIFKSLVIAWEKLAGGNP